MKTIRVIDEMQSFARFAKRAGDVVGLAPTMGSLHKGHGALIERCKELSDVTVVSVFVNPMQFAENEDYGDYPRSLDQDLSFCGGLNVGVVFVPSVAEMYEDNSSTKVVEASLGGGLCGPFRPGHFEGVTTVVAKLFNIVLPDVAVFGKKDIQQLQVIRRMARDLRYPVKIEGVDTVRENDGLAMSSRNRHLSGEERPRAAAVYAALLAARDLFREGVLNAVVIQENVREVLESKGRPDSIDYVAVVDGETLKPRAKAGPGTIVAIGARIGKTRLIDNIRLG